MTSIDKIITTVGKHEFIQPVARLFTRAFANDPLERSVILATEPLPPGARDGIITEDHWMKHWVHHVTAKIEGGGEIISAGEGAAVALWFPPGIKKSEFDRNASPFVLLDFADRFEGIKERVLGGKRFWYLNLVARDPERDEKGAVRAVIEPYLEKAKQEGIPVWLEATTTHARDVYIHFGFRSVAEVVVGKGSITKNGDYVVGGEGFVVYGMIAEPGKTGGII